MGVREPGGGWGELEQLNSSRRRTARGVDVPGDALLARFRRHYQDPALYESARYRTRDGLIPFGLFWIYLARIPNNLAYERLSEMRAIGGALAMAFAKSGAPTPESIRADQRDAYLSEG